MAMTKTLFVLFLSIIFFSSRLRFSLAADKNSLAASFVFGDSLVDAGNNNYLQTLSRANLPPNGIDFKASGGNPTGRFTNGRTIADIVGEELGQPNYAVPYLAPNASGEAILNGVNYASGAGGILNATGSVFVNRVGMDIQVDYFGITRKQLDRLLGPEKATDYVRKRSIFSIVIGANDFLNNYLVPFVAAQARLTQPPDAFVDSMISHLRDQLTRLYNLDARKFVVGNVGPIGCIPYQKVISQLKENECVDLANKLALRYNSRLKDLLLVEMKNKFNDANFVYANVYDLVMELIVNYKDYGFETASEACCANGGGRIVGILPCGPTSNLCVDRSKHVFWDAYHPSEAANLFIAKQLLHGDSTYISPFNLFRLRDL
ncbi:PREDICTED: GDSL esterase/lipase At3g50400 [Tarenaya hassleriana]|uniref:GDSL esterase/lipase At3g50400 n=1 Tax=Tarenaya hassleriana TaxID=28532 RepID=UPI00053C3B9F|nr:PREDICTED: GDSL esterase/lipase At3g50400 [Tarenaya hassleriana]